MANARYYAEVLTGADTDVLAGSELEFAPSRGLYIIRAASTVNSAFLAVSGNRSPVVSTARSITLRANGETRAEDAPWVAAVGRGEKLTIALSGTTGTTYIVVSFLGN